jgi:uncharacterized delta-60 repeat protein
LNDCLVLKLTNSGNLEWARTFGGTSWDQGSSIIQTSDGGYAIAGYTASFGTGNWDCFILKLTTSGALEWARTFGGTGADFAFSIAQTTDGGYAVAGHTTSFGAGVNDCLVFKLSSSGGLEWARAFGGTSSDNAFCIVQTSDGGYAVAGYTDSFGAGNYDFLVLKLASSGALAWARRFGGTYTDDEAFSIVQTSDGGYAVAGYTDSFGAGNYDFLVLKLASSGDLDWAKTFGGANGDYAWSIVQTSDSGYGVAGYTYSFGAGEWDFLILKLTSSGDLDWARTFGGTYHDEAQSIVQTTDGGYAVAGRTESFGAGNFDFLVLRLDSAGNYPDCVMDCLPTAGTPSLSVSSPTPSTSSPSVGMPCTPTVGTPTLTITDACAPLYEDEEGLSKGFEFKALGQSIYLFMPNQTYVSLTLYDAQGRLVQRLYDGVLTSGGHTFNPDLETKGVYMAVLRYQGGVKSLKIVR